MGTRLTLCEPSSPGRSLEDAWSCPRPVPITQELSATLARSLAPYSVVVVRWRPGIAVLDIAVFSTSHHPQGDARVQQMQPRARDRLPLRVNPFDKLITGIVVRMCWIRTGKREGESSQRVSVIQYAAIAVESGGCSARWENLAGAAATALLVHRRCFFASSNCVPVWMTGIVSGRARLRRLSTTFKVTTSHGRQGDLSVRSRCTIRGVVCGLSRFLFNPMMQSSSTLI